METLWKDGRVRASAFTASLPCSPGAVRAPLALPTGEQLRLCSEEALHLRAHTREQRIEPDQSIIHMINHYLVSSHPSRAATRQPVRRQRSSSVRGGTRRTLEPQRRLLRRAGAHARARALERVCLSTEVRDSTKRKRSTQRDLERVRACSYTSRKLPTGGKLREGSEKVRAARPPPPLLAASRGGGGELLQRGAAGRRPGGLHPIEALHCHARARLLSAALSAVLRSSPSPLRS